MLIAALATAKEIAFLGTLPQWGMLVTMVGAVLAFIPKWRQQSLDSEAAQIAAYRAEVHHLRTELKENEKRCIDERNADRKEIKELHEEIWGLRKQHIAEQISLINVILKSVDAPELHALRSVLESVQERLQIHKTIQERDATRGAST